MQTVLILTTGPPNSATGGRGEKIAYRCEQLLNKGYKPIVIKPGIRFPHSEIDLDNGTVEYYGSKNDDDDATKGEHKIENLKSKIINSVGTRTKEALQKAPIIDVFTPSIPFTVRKLNELIDTEDVTHIYSHTYPFSTNIVALLTKAYNNSIVWIMEYRDPWTCNPKHFPDGPDIVNRYAEAKCVQHCDALIYYNGIQMPDDYLEEAFSRYRDKIHMIDYIGFNERSVTSTNGYSNEPFTLIHAGSLWGSGSDLSGLFGGFEMFVEEYDLTPSDIQILFLGTEPKNGSQDSDGPASDIKEYLTSLGWLPHEECLSHIMSADYGIYLTRSFPRDQYNVSTKMYDYIGCRTPVLCLSKPGWHSWEFVNEFDIGTSAKVDDPASVYRVLESIFPDVPHEVSRETWEQFKRKKRFDKHIQIIEEIEQT